MNPDVRKMKRWMQQAIFKEPKHTLFDFVGSEIGRVKLEEGN